MSNRTGRRWTYRLSSIVRPTPHSSRDPSPRQNIEPPSSPTASSSFPPSPRSPLHDVQETKPTPALSSPELRHERVTTRQEIITYSAELFPAARSSHPQAKFPPLRRRSPPQDVQEAKPRHERVTTRQEIVAFPVKTHPTNGPNKENQQQIVEELAQAARPSHHPPPKPMSPPLRPLLPEEVKEAKPPLSPVTSSRSIKQESANPKQEHEITHQKNILTLPEETNLVHGPNEIFSSEFDGDVFMDTQDVVKISGDNKGAVMEILRSLKKTRGPNLLTNNNKTAEAKPKSKNYIKNGGNYFVNSNVQMLNGSVVYNSSESHHDPGVNLSLYRIPSSDNGYIIKDHGNGYTSSIN